MFVSFEAVGESALPVFLTQNEFMRRMKDMSQHQQGLSFYGSMPDQYNLVVNTAHPLIQSLLAAIHTATDSSVAPINEQLATKKKEEEVLQEQQKGKKEEELTQEEKDAVDNCTKELAALREQKKQLYAAFANDNEQLPQLIDIALLASGLLRGEALAKFVNRSVSLLK